MQILVLLSQFERLFQLSAPLIEGTYLLINGQVQALCKQHEPVHFTVQGENKTTVAVQVVTPL